jgi:superfamily II DNA/RNA helicase
MVCWLKFLKFVDDALRGIEPNLARRKAMAIEILKDMEKEEGHNIAKIEKRIKKEGRKGLLLRAKKKKKQKEEETEEGGETEEDEEPDEDSKVCAVLEEKW